MIQPHEERFKIDIPGTAKVRKEVKIGAASEAKVESRMVALLKEHVDTFAWSCQDMPGRVPMSLCTSYHGEKTVL